MPTWRAQGRKYRNFRALDRRQITKFFDEKNEEKVIRRVSVNFAAPVKAPAVAGAAQ
jgi:hypothetical protein